MEQFGFGAKKSSVDIRDYKLKATVSNIPDTYIIDTIHIKDQKNKSTCVAHALSEIVEFNNIKGGDSYRSFSTDFIYGCRQDNRYKSEGMSIRDGLKVIYQYGDVTEEEFPGNSDAQTAKDKVNKEFERLVPLAYPNRISTYYKITTEEELKQAIYVNGPAICGIKWYNGARVNRKHIVVFDENKDYTPHAILIIGWDKDNWICQNSWGKFWGYKGLFYVPKEQFARISFDIYGVTDDILSVKKPNKPTTTVAPTINWLINWLIKLFHKIFRADMAE